MNRRGFLAWAAVGLLSACASTPPSPVGDPTQVWQRRVESLSAISDWEVKGKLAVKTHKRGGQATMLWQRQAEDHSINLYGPLGGGRVVLSRTAEGATLRDNKKNTYHAPTAEELLYRIAGWQVPFGAMRYWVLGIPKPDVPYQQSLDERGRLQSLQQSGWDIEFLEYREFEGQELPRKFFMSARSGVAHIAEDQLGENDQVRVKVIIKRWRF